MDRQRRASFNRLKKKLADRVPGLSGPNAEMWDVFYAFELKRNEVAMAGLKAQRAMLVHERFRLAQITKDGRATLAAIQGKRI